MEIGFIGLGAMGRAMAGNLVKAGHSIRAWNRSPVATPIAGVTMVPSPGDAFDADIVFTMLSDDAAIRQVIVSSEALGHARKGAVHVVTSTISVEFADELAARHAQAGIGYVAAPVFGRPDVAEAAQLTVMVAGAASAVEKARPAIEHIGKRIQVLGDNPKQANIAKIAGNMMIAMAIEAMAEAVALTGSHGVSTEAFFELILSSLFGGRAYESYSRKITSGDYEPGFRMRLGLKDLMLATAAAETSGRRLPMLDAVRTRMAGAVEAGMGDKDWSAIADDTPRRQG